MEWYQKRYFESLQEDYLTPQDWQVLRETCSFLQPFWRITQLTEGRDSTLDQALFTMDVLHKHYTQAFTKYRGNHPLRSCIAASWAIFDKYYLLTDESPAYGAAMILHPSRDGKRILRRTGQGCGTSQSLTGSGIIGRITTKGCRLLGRLLDSVAIHTLPMSMTCSHRSSTWSARP